MSFNPLKLMQLGQKTAWRSFAMRHPKFPLFWKTALQTGTGGRNRPGIQGHYAGWQGADF